MFVRQCLLYRVCVFLLLLDTESIEVKHIAGSILLLLLFAATALLFGEGESYICECSFGVSWLLARQERARDEFIGAFGVLTHT